MNSSTTGRARSANLAEFWACSAPDRRSWAIELRDFFRRRFSRAHGIRRSRSPIGYGQMRKGRPGQRGKFVQVESRVSQTGASADEWIPCPSGNGRRVRAESRACDPARQAAARGSRMPERDRRLGAGLAGLRARKVENAMGVPAATITRIAHEAAANSPAVALDRRCSHCAHQWLIQCALGQCVELLLGSVGKPGGISSVEHRNAAASKSDGPAATRMNDSAHIAASDVQRCLRSSCCSTRIPCSARRPHGGVRDALGKSSVHRELR